MKKSFMIILALTVVGLELPAQAAVRTTSLSVPGMTCVICPITVKKALSRVEGVNTVSVSFEKREATVTFDDSKTTVDALTAATANAGYPSKAKDGTIK